VDPPKNRLVPDGAWRCATADLTTLAVRGAVDIAILLPNIAVAWAFTSPTRQ